MIYDRRAGPIAVQLENDRIYIAYQGQAALTANGKIATHPMVTEYNIEEDSFADPFIVGPSSIDHHHAPVIWPDSQQQLQILAGCHKQPGMHLVSILPLEIGRSLSDWTYGRGFPFTISYPQIQLVDEKNTLIYYRTYGHPSSWTYRTTSNDGRVWQEPDEAVTDLDSSGKLDWSSYHSVKLDASGKYLHVTFVDYDDNKAHEKSRYYNPRYQKFLTDGGQKYNLYYLKINLANHQVINDQDAALITPLTLDQAKSNCLIWDTKGRFTGLPPDIAIDHQGNPSLLHVLSGQSAEQFDYYFLRHTKGEWKRVKIRSAGHAWNNGYLTLDKKGIWHAYLVVTQAGQLGDGIMDKHGGGHLEEWISTDQGETWRKKRNLTPKSEHFRGWRFNNLRPVINYDGSEIKNRLICYGWPDSVEPRAQGFLINLLKE